MTFICAMGANGHFGAVGDVLLTSARQGEALHLPLHRLAQSRHGPHGHIGSMAQKAVILGGRTLVLWAGPVGLAQRALRRIEAVSDGGKLHVDVKTICDDLEIDPRAEGLSLIHCFIDDDFIQFNSANGRGRSEPRFYYGGSGAQHFLDELSPLLTHIEGEQQNPFVNVFLARILAAQIDEAVSGGVFEHHYGGWFEVIEIADGKFCKQSICLKTWEKKGDALATWGPLWFSSYNGEDLHVARVLTHAGKGDDVKMEIEVTVVPSILHAPTPEPGLEDLKCECAIEFHVVFDRDTGRSSSVVLHGLKPKDRFRWARTKDGAEMAVSPALQDALKHSSILRKEEG